MGSPEATLLRMAGWAQVQNGDSDPKFGAATNELGAVLGIGGKAPFGDDPADQAMIRKGMEYYRKRASNHTGRGR